MSQRTAGKAVMYGLVTLYTMHNIHTVFNIIPRPAGVWLVTRPAGGGGGAKGPL